MRRTQPFRQLSAILPAIALSAFVLGGCFPDTNVSSENSFPQGDGTGSGFSDSTAGDSSNTPSQPNQVRVSVQVPAGLTEGEPGRRNLVTTGEATLRVDRVDANLNRIQSFSPRIETDGNDFILTFEGSDSVPSDLDLVVTASVAGHNFRAPLAAGSRHVRINPFTHYLIERGLKELSQSDFSRLKGCNQTLCLQTLIWSPLADQVQNFEIDIPSNSSPATSLNRLEERADFADFVDQAIQNLRLDEDQLTSLEAEGIDASAFEFNAIYFSAELNQALDADGNDSPAFWATRLPTVGSQTNKEGTSFAYPNLTIASFALELFDLNITSLSLDIPFERYSGDASSLDHDTNAHSTSPGPAFVRNERYLTAVRPVLQTITRPGELTIGWALDPHFMDAWIVGENDDPKALLSSYFHGGKAIQLSGSSGNFQRQQTREELGVGSFEINLARTSNDFNFSNHLASEYNVVGLELRADENGLPGSVRGRFGRWELTASGALQGDGTEDVEEWTLTPDTSTTDNGPQAINGSFDLDGIEQARTDSETDGFRGHLFLNAPHLGTANEANIQPSGAVEPSGNLMAFSLDTPNDGNRGQLFQIASAIPESEPDLRGAYRLQGLILQADNDGSRIQQLNGSCLAIATSTTELVKRGLEVERARDTGSAERPTRLEETVLQFEPVNGKYDEGTFEVEIENGTTSVLQGMVAEEDGSTLVILKRTEHSLGILLGFRESETPSDCE